MERFKKILLVFFISMGNFLVYAQEEALTTQLISYDEYGKFYEQFLYPSVNGKLFSVYHPHNDGEWKYRVLDSKGSLLKGGVVPMPYKSVFIGAAENDDFMFFIFDAKISKKVSLVLLSINKSDYVLGFKAYPYSRNFDSEMDLLNAGLSSTGIIMEFGYPKAFRPGYFVYLSFNGNIKEFDSDSLVRLTPCVINKSDLGPAFAYYNELKSDNRIQLILMNEKEEFEIRETGLTFNGNEEVPNYLSRSGTIIRFSENEYFIAIPEFEANSLTSVSPDSIREDSEKYKFNLISIRNGEKFQKILCLDEEIMNIKYKVRLMGGSINYLLFSGFIDTPKGYAIAIEKVKCDANLAFNSSTMLGTSIGIEKAMYNSSKLIVINHQFEVEYKAEVDINFELNYPEFINLVDEASTFEFSNLIRLSQLFVNNEQLYLGFMKGSKLQITRFDQEGKQVKYSFNTATENFSINPFEKISYYQGENILFVKQYANMKIKPEEKLFYLINSYQLK